jgi:hypothetical protein
VITRLSGLISGRIAALISGGWGWRAAAATVVIGRVGAVVGFRRVADGVVELLLVEAGRVERIAAGE